MENKTDADQRDELRKLQDKVRKLEYQNEQLRSQHTKNGIIENTLLSNASNENYIMHADSNFQVDDQDILSINSDDFVDEERWLYVSPSSTTSQISSNPANLQKWLRQDVDNNNDIEFQLIKTKLIHELDEIEQGLRRNNIDTRTFTRPKKRLSRPGLEMMVESPLLRNRGRILSPWRTAQSHNDDIDELHHSLSSPYSSLLSENTLMNANFPISDSAELNSLFEKITSEPQINLSARMKSFQKTITELEDSQNVTYQKISQPELITAFQKNPDQCQTVTPKSVDLNATFQITPKSRSTTALNCTFQINDGSSSGSNRSGRAMSCDSGGDDDQHSSASDSSFSSSNRLMNVGDVQNIARLQEESLKQVMSTPKHNQKRDGILSCHEEDLPSPILKDYHGYQSDHSDHSSSADGRARSSRSSLRSSPGGSPYGSTQILTHVPESVPCNPVVGMPRRDLKVIPAGKQEVPRPQMAVKPLETAQPNRARGMSGLRPPTVRSSRGISTGAAAPAPRAPSQGRTSSIPRPASRIPPPRIRTTAYSAQQTNKVNWMDGCY